MTLSRSQPKQEKEINIQVVVRCRGRNDRERRESSVPAMDIAPLSGREITLRNGVNVRNYTFDRVFGPQADQKEIYDNVVQPILDEVLQGYNCTIFAYGQTGTGKTYTMEGDLDMQMPSFADSSQRLITSGLGSIRIPTNAGIIPRTLYQLFKAIGNDPASMVTVSYMELYNEEFRDLFVDTNAKGESNGPHIQVFDTGTKGNIQFQGLEEKRVQTAEQAIALMRDGSLRRRVAATRCNDTSSRSHAIFTINVLVRESALGSDGDYVLKRGKLNLVDLAGSENIGRSGAENMRAREAGQINQSLLTLGRVITCLVEKHQHIPYRDSKLTRVLKDSLGGKTRTCLIATVSPSKASIEETIKTLDYAGKAKSIKNKPAANRTVSKADIIIELTGKINRLEDDLNAARDKMGFYVSKETYDQLVEDSKSAKMRGESWQNERVLMEDNLNQLNDENRKLKEKYEEMEDKLSVARNQLVQTQQELENARQDYKNQIVVSKAHAMHEEELDEAARTLHSSLSAAARDSVKLHAKISRMQEREQLNLNAVARIGSLVGEETSRTLSSVAEYSKQAGAQTQQLLATLHDRVGEQFETEIRTKLSEAESRLAAHLAELAEKAAESGAEQRDACVASIESVSELVAQLKVTMDDLAKKCVGACEQSTLRMEQSSQCQLDGINSAAVGVRSLLDKCVADSAAVMKEAQLSTEKDIAAMYREIEELRAQNAEYVRSFTQKIESLRSDSESSDAKLLETITTMISERRSLQDGVLAESIESAQKQETDTGTRTENLLKRTRSIGSEIDLLAQGVLAKVSRTQADVDERVATDVKAASDLVSSMQAEVKSHSQSITALFAEAPAATSTTHGRVVQAEGRLKQSVEQMHAALIAAVAESRQLAVASHGRTTQTVGQAIETWHNAREELSELAGTQAKERDHFGSALSNGITAIAGVVERETKSGILPTPVTAGTPRATRYQSVSSWNRTIPDLDIIRKLDDPNVPANREILVWTSIPVYPSSSTGENSTNGSTPFGTNGYKSPSSRYSKSPVRDRSPLRAVSPARSNSPARAKAETKAVLKRASDKTSSPTPDTVPQRPAQRPKTQGLLDGDERGVAKMVSKSAAMEAQTVVEAQQTGIPVPGTIPSRLPKPRRSHHTRG